MSGDIIRTVQAHRIWDSRGRPTVEVLVELDDGSRGRGMAPAGASRGRREAVDLRDGGARLGGLDVQKALSNVNALIRPALIGMAATDQAGIDGAMVALDGTDQLSRLGGNATVATSLAILHGAAAHAKLPLWAYLARTHEVSPSIPLPEIQIFGGGAHAGRRVDVQDFMVMVPGASSFAEALEVTAEIYHAAGAILGKKGKLCGVADEGGWWPEFSSNEEALETLTRAIEMAGERPGDRVVISLDIAASEFFKDGLYRLGLENRTLSSAEMIDMLGGWIRAFAIASIEDPLAENDREGMIAFTAAYGRDVQIIGDDFVVTNARLINEAADMGACNAALIKVNQAGTVTAAVAALKAARAKGWGTVVSARSGETEDVTIAHLAVGLAAGQLKVGSFARSERMAKWNECLRLERDLGTEAAFAGGLPLAYTSWGRGR